MDENIKKNLFWILIIVALLIGAVLILIFRPRGVKPTPVTASQIDDLQVLAPAASTDGQEIYFYDLKESNLAKYNLSSGIKTPVSDKIGNQPMNLIWSPDRSQVIIKFLYDKKSFQGSIFANSAVADQSTALWDYDLASQKYTLLNTNIYNPPPAGPLNPVWTPDSKKIIYYLAPSGKETSLYMANPDNTGVQNLGKIPGDIYSTLSYAEGDNVLYYASYSLETNLYSVYKFDIKNQAKNSLLTNSNLALPLNDHQIIADNR